MQQVNERLLPDPPPGNEWLPVRLGESGDRVYRRSDGVAYAKLSTGAGVLALNEERRRTEWLNATGIACPQVLNWTEDEGGACLVTSAVAGIPASELSARELGKAWPSIVRQIKAFHDLSITDCPFERRLTTMFDRARDVVARGAVNPDFLNPNDHDTPPTTLLENLEKELPQRFAQEPDDLVVCHGDACLPNFIVSPDTLCCAGMIDLGRLGLADRYVDLSLLIANSKETWRSPEEAQAAYTSLFEIYEIPQPDQGRLDFYLRLDPLTWG